MFYRSRNLWSLIFLMTANQILSQEQGRTYIRNYPPPEYRASQQNWSIGQDKRGVIYFGNNDGLLEFDGISWRLTKMPIVRTLTIDSLGCIYVGLENDMGYVLPDSSGTYRYVSLKSKIPEAHRDISATLYVYLVRDAVVFLADDKLFIYRNGNIKVLTSAEGFHHMFKVRNRLFVRERGKGLLYLENDSLIFINGSERFADERIYSMLAYREKDILLFTRTQGVLCCSMEAPANFRKPAGFGDVDEFLLNNPVYCGSELPGGDFAIGALTGGIIIFNSEGTIKSRFGKSTGLQDNTIYWLFTDSNQQLWAAQDNGISMVPVNLPFRSYSEANGLNGSPMCLQFFRNRFYVGTSQYLHIQKPNGDFEQISNIEGQSFRLFDAGGTLLLATYQGLFEIDGKKASQLSKGSNVTALSICSLKDHPGKMLLGSADDGLYLLELKNSSWAVSHHLTGFEKSAYEVIEDPEGNIWISSAVDLYRLNLNPELDSVRSWKQYSTESGLPSKYACPYRLNSGEVVFGTEKGIFRYLPDSDNFVQHPDFKMLTGKVLPFVQISNGDIWFEELSESGNYEKGVLKPDNGRYIMNKTPFYKFTDIRCYESSYNICEAPDGTIFIGTSSGLIRYDPTVRYDFERPFNTLIRTVYSKNELLFGGEKYLAESREGIDIKTVRYTDNDLIFHFAAAFYENSEKNLFSYRLNGSDSAWSVWSNDPKKEYTNLHEGKYIFEVRSRNQYGKTGSTATYAFQILPPWHRTWWAYSLYVAAAILIFYFLLHLRTRQLRHRSQELEKMVEQRTAQIQEQKDNVEQLSRIGRDITSSLSIVNIIQTVYENVNKVMDATIFTIGLYKPEEDILEFPAAIERNDPIPPFTISLKDEARLGAWCFNHREDVIINNYTEEYNKYINQLSDPIAGEQPESVLYLPLWNKDKVTGVISTQSFSRNAYTDYHINLLRNLATYTAIALENADSYRHLGILLDELKATQDRMVTQSKLAALGSLTAGIAHEIKNPLNFVNNFASLNTELIEELRQLTIEDAEYLQSERAQEYEELLLNLKQNSEKIQQHGNRADKIVSNMIQHSGTSAGEPAATDLNTLIEDALELTYHGMKAHDSRFDIKMETNLDRSMGKTEVIPREISRVFLNIIGNGCYEAYRKKQESGSNFFPSIKVTSQKTGKEVKISVRDNGNGIPKEIRGKLFTPFFTTKPSGEGTGLGLSISYDIVVHQHKGQLSFESEEGNFAEFTIVLPYIPAKESFTNSRST